MVSNKGLMLPRPLAVALLVTPALLLAGCAEDLAPLGDAEAAHAGTACEGGTFVAGFDAHGAPVCAATFLDASCEAGAVMVGLHADGALRCAPIMDVAQEAAEQERAQQPPSQPAKSLAITSAGPLEDGMKTYTIASASPGIQWADLAIAVNGAPLTRAEGCAPAPGEFAACAGEEPATAVSAGDSLVIHAGSGETMRIIDAGTNSVILTVTVG